MLDYYWNILTKIKKFGKRTTREGIIKKNGGEITCGDPLQET